MLKNNIKAFQDTLIIYNLGLVHTNPKDKEKGAGTAWLYDKNKIINVQPTHQQWWNKNLSAIIVHIRCSHAVRKCILINHYSPPS